MKRIRIKPRGVIWAAPQRTKEYYRLRWYWLIELYNIRAKRKYGNATTKDVKLAQRELARLRKEM